jgi:integrase
MLGTVRRPIQKLDPGWVKRTPEIGMHADGGGLYLQVSRFGTKSWIFRFMLDGRRREMGLGPFPSLSLAGAREKAADCRNMVRSNRIDPIETRKAQRNQARIDAAKAMTFRQCAEAYVASHQAGWRNAKHRAQWASTLATYVYPVFGSLPAQAVDVGLVMKVLEPIWTTKPETASRVRGRIESILDWAMARGYRQGENPARWRGHLDQLLPKKSKIRRVKHHAALLYAETGNFMADLRQREGIAARALDFTILTVRPRTGGVIGAKWPEIDWKDCLWTIPAERMKKGEREFKVPLSDAAMAILKEMQKVRQNDFIFPGAKAGRSISDMAMLMTLRRMGRDDLTVHGFRSTFKDWASDCTNFPREIVEMAMAHAVEDKVEAAYRRGEALVKRRQLMNRWARYCASARGGDNVVQIAASR